MKQLSAACALVLAIVVLAAMPAPAGAAPGYVVIKACQENFQSAFWERPQLDWFLLSINCPEIRIAGGPISHATQQVATRYGVPYPRDATISLIGASMSFTGLGPADAGRRQGVRFCSSTACGLVMPDSPREGFMSMPRDVGVIPSGAHSIEVVGTCDLPGGCPAIDPLTVRDISLVYEDRTPPTLVIPPRIATDLQPGSWVATPKNIRYTATDNGAGVLTTRFYSQRSGMFWDAFGQCANMGQLEYLYLCPRVDEGPEITPFDELWANKRLPDGYNTIEIRAIDMAGNSSPKQTISFHKDTVPPAAPRGLHAVGAPHGWINQATASIEWDSVAVGFLGSTRVQVGGDAPVTLPGDPRRFDGVAPPLGSTTTVKVRAIDAAGNVGAESALTVGRDEHTLAAPQLNLPQFFGRDSIGDDRALAWSPPADASSAPSGVCGYGMSVSGAAGATPPESADITATSSVLPSDRPDGEQFVHLRAVSCSGQPGEIAHAPITYDLTSPDAGDNRPSSGWLDEGDPLVITGRDVQSGVDALRYTVDGGPQLFEPADTVDIRLAEGMHEVRYQARDRAGNWSELRAVTFGVDGSPPAAWIEPVDPARPTLVRAFATDSRAGLSTGQLLYRPFGSGAGWTAFGSEQGAAGASQALVLSARFPDVELPDGVYELGVRVRDRVGRETLSTLGTTAPAATISLPLRALPKLVLRIDKPPRRVRNAFVAFGSGAEVVGRLTDEAGAPLRRTPVELLERRVWTAPHTRLRTLVTDADGKFRARVKPGVSREIFARYGGSELLEPVEPSVGLATRAKVKLSVDRQRVRAGGPLRFDMRVALAGATLGVDGKLADLQFRDRSGQWKNYTTPGIFRLLPGRRHPGWARWRHTELAPQLTGARRIDFRLAVPREPRWPYADGWSNAVSVVVVPARGR